jgi:hypothetical protein
MEASIGKAFKVEAIVILCFGLNNAAYGSLRLARRVKTDEIYKRFSSELLFQTSN